MYRIGVGGGAASSVEVSIRIFKVNETIMIMIVILRYKVTTSPI